MAKHKQKYAKKYAIAPPSPKQLGLKAFQQNDYPVAIKNWSKPELESDSAVRAALAETYFRRGLARRNDLPASLADLQQTVNLLPGEARFWHHLGLALHRADRLTEACAAYARAAELGDDLLLARAQQVLRDRLEGVEELSQIVSQLEAAKREGREDDAAALGEQLLDLLYQLEEEE